MRVLRVAAALEVARRLGQGRRSVESADVLADVLQRVVGDARGVGAHVRDQSDRAAPGDLAAFVESLRDLHRAPHRETEPRRGRLLELRGDEGRRRVLAPLGGLDRRDRPGRLRDVVDDARWPTSSSGRRGICSVELELLAVEGGEARRELGRNLARELRVDRPVLDRDERFDLALALADDAEGDGLDPAGGEAPPDLLPEQVRDLVSDEAVDDAPGLLGVDALRVDLARVFHGREHGLLGDLVEAHPTKRRRLAGSGLQRLAQVPGDGFALAVGVGREIDRVRGLGRALELVDRLLFSGEHFVGRLVGVLAIDTQALARQIPHVAVRGHDLEALAEELLEGLGLRGGLDDDDGLGHTGRGTSHNGGERANRGSFMSRNKSLFQRERS